MTFDPSKLTYAHITCGQLPCVCKWEHKPLSILEFSCETCKEVFLTVNQLQEHKFNKHLGSVIALTSNGLHKEIKDGSS